MNKTKAWYGKYQTILQKWMASWQEKAREMGGKWFPPGLANGLMAEFLGEALELGAITLNDSAIGTVTVPPLFNAAKSVPTPDLQAVESLATWLKAATVDDFPSGCWLEGQELHIQLGAQPVHFVLTVTASRVDSK